MHGDIVLDPMCGTGTTCVEAAHLDRHTVGVENEPRWVNLAKANLDHAWGQGATGGGWVLPGDARSVLPRLAASLGGKVALVLTSSPTRHRQASGGQRPRARRPHRPPAALGDLTGQPPPRVLAGLQVILAGCVPLLRPSGLVVLTVGEWWEHGRLVDVPAVVTATARAAGLVPVERCVALLGRLRDGELTPTAASFGHRTWRADGLPLRAPAHEDVLVFTPNPVAAGFPAMVVCPPLAAA